jgi:hypothetical protein
MSNERAADEGAEDGAGLRPALLLIPSQLNWGVDMTGLLSRENWNGAGLR